MKTEIKRISPEIAKLMLEKNVKNRPIKKKTVEFYSTQMKNGDWKLTGQGISFGKSGNLIDGQHRLQAIINSNVTVDMLVISDIEDDYFKQYDTGKTRSSADTLGVLGVKNAVNIASGIVKYYGFKKNVLGKAKELKLTNEIISKTYFDNKLNFDKYFSIASKCYAKLRIYTQSEIIGYLAYYNLHLKIDLTEIENFFLASVDLIEVNNSNPKLLKDKLVNFEFSGRPLTGQLRKNTIMYVIKKYLEGYNLKRITIIKN